MYWHNRIKKWQRSLLGTTALATAMLFSNGAHAQQNDITPTDNVRASSVQPTQSPEDIYYNYYRHVKHLDARRHAIESGAVMAGTAATGGNLAAGFGMSGAALGIDHLLERPHKGMIPGTDDIPKAVPERMARLNENDFRFATILSPLGGGAMSKMMMGGSPAIYAPLVVAPMIGGELLAETTEAKYQKEFETLPTNRTLGKELVTFSRNVFSSSDVALSNGQELKQFIEYYRDHGEHSDLTDRFYFIYDADKGKGPVTAYLNDLGQKLSETSRKVGRPILLSEFVDENNPESPFYIQNAGDNAQAQENAIQLVRASAQHPKWLYDAAPAFMLTGDINKFSWYQRHHHKHKSKLSLPVLSTPDEIVSNLAEYKAQYPAAPFEIQGPKAFLKLTDGTLKSINIVASLQAGKNADDFQINPAKDQIDLVINKPLISFAAQAAFVRLTDLSKAPIAPALAEEPDSLIPTITTTSVDASIIEHIQTPTPKILPENAVTQPAPREDAELNVPPPVIHKTVSPHTRSVQPISQHQQQASTTSQNIRQPHGEIIAPVRPNANTPPLKKPKTIDLRPAERKADTVIITSLAPRSNIIIPPAAVRSAAPPSFTHRMADRVLRQYTAGQFSHLPTRVFYDLPIEAANRETARQIATQHLSPIFPKQAITRHPERLTDQDYQKNLLPILERRHLAALTQSTHDCHQFNLHLADKTLGNDKTQTELKQEGFKPDAPYNNAYKGYLLQDAWQELGFPNKLITKDVRIDASGGRHHLDHYIEHVVVDQQKKQITTQIKNQRSQLSTVIATLDQIKASDSDDATLAVTVAKAKAMGWNSYNIKATGAHLIRTARAFTVNGLTLDVPTQAAVLVAMNEKQIAAKTAFKDFEAVKAEFLRPPQQPALHRRRHHQTLTQYPQVCGP